MADRTDDRLITGGAFTALSGNGDAHVPSMTGAILGGYEVGELLGTGGMGYVLKATRAEGDFDRDAAIKIVEVTHRSSEFAQRFRQEVKILAKLNHPGIAQLYDAGTTDAGWPYLVMEFIDGRPIDQYCLDENVSLEARLGILLQVVDAIQFAHAQLVVHRDLKPSNVIVNKNGEAKLLDFGIAMLLESDQQDMTQGGAMTPQYASPEQVLGERISIATDIYQFGLLMTKVLTDTLPNEEDNLAAQIKRAAEGRSVSLTQSQRQMLPNELVLIIEQCLRNDARDRYRDITSVKNDLQAFLSGHPVSAAGQTRFYRASKFVKRNKWSFLAASFAVLALLTSTVITAWQTIEANQQRDLAIYQQQRVQASSEFYSLLFEEMGGNAYSSLDLLDRGRQLLEDQFGTDQPFMGSVLLDVSRRYASMGEQDNEMNLLQEAEAIARVHQDDELLAAVLCRMAKNNRVRSPEQAAAQLAEGLAIYGVLTSPTINLSISCGRAKADDEIKSGDYDAALTTLFALQQRIEQHPVPDMSNIALVLNDIAAVYFYSRQLNETIDYLSQSLSVLESAGRGRTVRYQQIATNRAVTLQTHGQTLTALAAFETLIAQRQDTSFNTRGNVAFVLQYGDLLVSLCRYDEAEAAYREAIADARVNGHGRLISANEIGFVKVYVAKGQFDLAQQHLNAAKKFINNGEPRPLAISTGHYQATLDRLSGNPDKALHDIEILLNEIGYPDAQHGPGMLSVITEAAVTHSTLQQHQRAMDLADALVSRARFAYSTNLGNVHLGQALLTRAEVYDAAGHAVEAATSLDQALPHLSAVLPADDHRMQLAARLSHRFSSED